jgi:hypothetical protein
VVDLLASGPPEQPGRPPAARPWRARVRRLWGRPDARVAAVLLVVAVALVVLRSTVDPQPRPRALPAPLPTSAPVPTITPLDGLPGRTPIPAPAQTGDLLSGPLPVTGPVGRTAARAAAGLVLGRFCADLTRYVVELRPDTDGVKEDYHHLFVLVTDRDLTDSGPGMQLSLDWQVRSYRWLGPLTLLNGC